MTVTKYTVSREGGLRPEGEDVGLKYDLSERAKCPEAFLLSEKEIVLVHKARQLLQVVFEPYNKVEDKSFTKDLRVKIGLEYIELLRRKRISITKLKKAIYKLDNSQYWSVYLTEVKIKNGFLQRFKVIISNPDIKVAPDNIIDNKTHPSYFEAKNRADQAKAIGIPEMYFYISEFALDTLKILSVFFSCTVDSTSTKTEQVIDDSTDPFYSVINSKPLNAFYSIGQNIKTPEVKKERNEKGKQIEITEYATNIGVTLSFKAINPFDSVGDISVGDPNTDKLLLQGQLACVKTKQQAVEIPLRDFMKFRGLNDSKSALSQARQACKTLLGAKYILEAESETASLYGGINYVQECYVGKNSNKDGNRIYINFSDKLYQHIIEYADQGRQIEKLDKRVATIPNNQTTAYHIFRVFSSHLRGNVDRPTSHRLSVKTLLGYCLLPLYPFKDSDVGKTGYLPLRRQASQKIIDPFIKALEYLVDNGFFTEWTFTHTNGNPLTPTETTEVYNDFNLFYSLNVDVKLSNEPDYNHLIENKAKQRDKAEKAKKTTKQAKKSGT